VLWGGQERRSTKSPSERKGGGEGVRLGLWTAEKKAFFLSPRGKERRKEKDWAPRVSFSLWEQGDKEGVEGANHLLFTADKGKRREHQEGPCYLVGKGEVAVLYHRGAKKGGGGDKESPFLLLNLGGGSRSPFPII